MSVGRVGFVVGREQVPASARELSALPRLDYGDRAIMSTGVRAAPEQWARAIFGNMPNAAQRVLWHGLLGLRLDRHRRPDLVAGWRIVGRGDGWVRLEASSRLLTGNLVVESAQDTVALGTYLHYRHPFGRGVWTVLSPIHRRLVPGLLPRAADRLATRGDHRSR